MELKITKKCGRCGKAEEVSGTLEEAQKLMDQASTRKGAVEHLTEVFRELSDLDEPPQVIVALLNPETLQYEHKTLYDLCSKEAGEGKRRGCTARVTDLVADLFNIKDELAEPKVRKPRAKKVVESAQAPEVKPPVIASLNPENTTDLDLAEGLNA